MNKALGRRPRHAPLWTIASMFVSVLRSLWRRPLKALTILVPILFVLAALLALAASSGVLAPFVYPIL